MNKKLTVVKNNNTMVNFCEPKRIICKSDVKKYKKIGKNFKKSFCTIFKSRKK